MRKRERDRVVAAKVSAQTAQRLDKLVALKQLEQSLDPCRRKKHTASDTINLALIAYLDGMQYGEGK